MAAICTRCTSLLRAVTEFGFTLRLVVILVKKSTTVFFRVRTKKMSACSTLPVWAEETPQERVQRMIFIIITFIIVIIGIVGNVFVMATICAIKGLRTVPNIFIVNLCVADLLLSVNTVTLLLGDVSKEIKDGIEELSFLCRITSLVTWLPPFAVALSMVVIAHNRSATIRSLARYRRCCQYTRRKVVLLLILIWSVSIVACVPLLVPHFTTIVPGPTCACCLPLRHVKNTVYIIVVSVLVYAVPNICIAYFYIRIFCFVRKSRRRVQAHGHVQQPPCSVSPAPPVVAKRSDIRLAVQFILIFIIFNICYLPSIVTYWVNPDHITVAWRRVINVLFTFSIVSNPLLYLYFNRQARAQIRAKLCCQEMAPTISGSDAGASQNQLGSCRKPATSLNINTARACPSSAVTLQVDENQRGLPHKEADTRFVPS